MITKPISHFIIIVNIDLWTSDVIICIYLMIYIYMINIYNIYIYETANKIILHLFLLLLRYCYPIYEINQKSKKNHKPVVLDNQKYTKWSKCIKSTPREVICVCWNYYNMTKLPRKLFLSWNHPINNEKRLYDHFFLFQKGWMKQTKPMRVKFYLKNW